MTCKILIVEDDFILARVTELQLQKAGYEVSGSVDNAEKALEMCEAELPDIVIMDIQLNGPMDGIEAAEKLSKMGNLNVIFLTGNSDPNTKSRALETGYTEFLVKPVDSSELLKSIDNVLENN